MAVVKHQIKVLTPYRLREARSPSMLNGLLPRKGVVIIAGSPYSGKTLVALDLMQSVGHGRSWLGEFAHEKMEVLDETGRPHDICGHALYIGNDAPAWDVARQFWKLGGGAPDEWDSSEHAVWDPFGFVFDPRVQLNDQAWVEAIIETINQGVGSGEWTYGNTKAEVVVFDTLRALHGYDENDNTMMQDIMNRLRYISDKTGTCVVALHHFNKAYGKETSSQALDRLRGATAMGGAADVVIALEADVKKHGTFTLTVVKNRATAKPYSAVFQQHQPTETTLVLRRIAGSPTQAGNFVKEWFLANPRVQIKSALLAQMSGIDPKSIGRYIAAFTKVHGLTSLGEGVYVYEPKEN